MLCVISCAYGESAAENGLGGSGVVVRVFEGGWLDCAGTD